jgi:hypothetical protein
MELKYFIIRNNTTIEHIEAQKRELSKLHHPDMAGGDETTMTEINLEFVQAIEKIKKRDRLVSKISNIEKHTLFVNTLVKPRYEPQLKELTKRGLSKLVNRYSPKILKGPLNTGLGQIAPIIENADTSKIANKLFDAAKFIARIF